MLQVNRLRRPLTHIVNVVREGPFCHHVIIQKRTRKNDPLASVSLRVKPGERTDIIGDHFKHFGGRKECAYVVCMAVCVCVYVSVCAYVSVSVCVCVSVWD